MPDGRAERGASPARSRPPGASGSREQAWKTRDSWLWCPPPGRIGRRDLGIGSLFLDRGIVLVRVSCSYRFAVMARPLPRTRSDARASRLSRQPRAAKRRFWSTPKRSSPSCSSCSRSSLIPRARRTPQLRRPRSSGWRSPATRALLARSAGRHPSRPPIAAYRKPVRAGVTPRAPTGRHSEKPGLSLIVRPPVTGEFDALAKVAFQELCSHAPILTPISGFVNGLNYVPRSPRR